MTKIMTTDLRKAFFRTDSFGRRIWTYRLVAEKAGCCEATAWLIINGKKRRDTPSRRKVIEALGLKEARA